MRDSFNNRLEVGDRVLCIEPRSGRECRRNQIGTIIRGEYSSIVVEYDSNRNQEWEQQPTRRSTHTNFLLPNEDIFIKLETNTEVGYRVGDKVLCYCNIDNDHPFIGTVTQESNNELCKIADELGINHILTKSEILFLLERTQYKVGDEIIVKEYYSCNTNSLYYTMGYDQSIPTRIDAIGTSHSFIRIEIDDPRIGWRERDERNRNSNHSYWTLTDTKSIFPKEFSYSLPFARCWELQQTTYNTEQINSTVESATVLNEPGVQQLFSGVTRLTNSFEQIDYIQGDRTVSNVSTPKIHTYSYQPKKFQFHKEEEDTNENNLYLGIELEISGLNKLNDNEEEAREILKAIQKDGEDFVYFKHDSSVDGFEIVFQPHTIKAYNQYNWKGIFSTIRKLGYTNNNKKAGFHVHISRSYFGDTAQQNEALAKLIFLLYKFKTEIEPLAGRKDSEYAIYNTIGLETAKRNDFYGTFYWYSKNSGKYSAINSQHKDTFEIRIFDGVTNEQRLVDILTFIESLCITVKNTSPMDITKVKLEDFMSLSQSMEELS